MARALIVGCGCRGQALARALIADGHTARGTTRRRERLAEIAATGAEAVVADPLRLATIRQPLDGASLVVWLMGTASGDPSTVAALHGSRLETMLRLIVDSHARGFVYEAAGSDHAGGARAVARAGETFAMPVQVVDDDPADRERWLAAMRGAVAAVLAA